MSSFYFKIYNIRVSEYCTLDVVACNGQETTQGFFLMNASTRGRAY